MHGQRGKNSAGGAHKLARLPVPISRGRTRRSDRHMPPLLQQRAASWRLLPLGPKEGGSDNAETSAISAQAAGLRTKATPRDAAKDALEASLSEAMPQTSVLWKSPSALYTAQDEGIIPITAEPSPPSERSTTGGRRPLPPMLGPPRGSPKIASHWPTKRSTTWPYKILHSWPYLHHPSHP